MPDKDKRPHSQPSGRPPASKRNLSAWDDPVPDNDGMIDLPGISIISDPLGRGDKPKGSPAPESRKGGQQARAGTARPAPSGSAWPTAEGEAQPAKKAAPKGRKRRRLKKSAVRALSLVVVAGAILGLALVITNMINKGRGDVAASSEPAVIAGPNGEDTPPFYATLPAVDPTGWNFVGPIEQSAEAMQLVTPDKRMMSLPENGRVDMQYFNTSVFVGDSLTQGLQQFGHIPNAKYCAYVGVGPRQIYEGTLWTNNEGVQEVPIDALVAHQPDNVYILLGTNAMVNMDNETLLLYYNDMLDVMRERLHPEVSIYVQSITPVLQGVDARFSYDNIAYLNDQLAKMTFQKGMYFLDLHEALAGDDGWLRSDYGSMADGYHLTGAGYSAWVEYLVTHTAYNRRHAQYYLEGSHYFQQTPPVA